MVLKPGADTHRRPVSQTVAFHIPVAEPALNAPLSAGTACDHATDGPVQMIRTVTVPVTVVLLLWT